MQPELKRESNMSQETPDTKISIEMINEIHKTTDRALELWRHVAQFSYEHQFSLAKNYQWLNITFLTACAAIYAEFIKSNPNLSYLEIVCFAVAVASSVVSLVCSILVISSNWLKVELISGPLQNDTSSAMIERLLYYGVLSGQHCEELKNSAQWYDISIERYLILANKRGKILRIQWRLTLCSLMFISITLCCFLML